MISVYRHSLLAALLAAACRAGPPTPGAAPAPALPAPGAAPSDTTCRLAPGPAAKRDTVAVALAEPIDPSHAPLPRNDAERFVFAHLYETLIRVDCAGRVLPGLAQSWDASGDRWTFTLRDDARFWDGAPVTARDVLAAWRARDSTFAQSATVLGDRTIAVRPPAAPVQPLADPALAVTKRAPGGDWPIGTGGHWVSETDAAGTLSAVPVRRGTLPALRISTVPAGRTRDALDEGSDLVITGDPAVLEYAATRPAYVDVPLDWNRTYVLLAPGHPDGLGDIRRESLRDAVHLDARPAESENGRFWLADLQACGFPGTRDTAVSAPRRQRVVYDQSDRNAADLAARLVGLGTLGNHSAATGLAPAAFAAALRAGGDAAYVLALRRRVFDVCRAALELPPWTWTGRVEPLLDVRPHALVRRGLPPLQVDWDGTPRISPR
jgi:Bacterial extracellular solute-binding proteins, family 5 Middle